MFGPGFTSRRVFNEELANQLQQIVVGRPLKRRALVFELVELFKERSKRLECQRLLPEARLLERVAPPCDECQILCFGGCFDCIQDWSEATTVVLALLQQLVRVDSIFEDTQLGEGVRERLCLDFVFVCLACTA